MARFRYQSGQRVLDGYTIKRGVGSGGFGEVYFAVSDSGKEVALKYLTNTDVEMRGVLNCLNLKHPNLVHVYDVKEDSHGDTWIIMEFVMGESLGQVIARNTRGLSTPHIRTWFGALASAVDYLHSQGVVHRDLKPANIFIESGGLKVGDYGLCKSISSGQKLTKRVGTANYMAPEIGSGNYTKSIDIYACGVLLYEMVTGKLPFDGESENEIFIKHLTAAPDLTCVPPAFSAVLAKALEKNPLKRYASMGEFARAVEVACLPTANPSPAAVPIPLVPPFVPSATVVASPMAEREPIILPEPIAAKPLPAFAQTTLPEVTGTWRDYLSTLTGSMLAAPAVAALTLVPYAVFAPSSEWTTLAKVFLLTSVASWVMLLGAWGRPFRSADAWFPRIRFAVLGLLLGLLVFRLDGWMWPQASLGTSSGQEWLTLFGVLSVEPEAFSVLARYSLYFGAVLGIGRWWRITAPDRKERISLWPPIFAAIWGWLLVFLWPWESGSPAGNPWASAIVPLALGAVAAQVVSPWVAPPAPLPKRLRLKK